MLRYLKNLSSQALHEGVAPWDFKPEHAIPENVREDKEARDAWINNPKTQHHVYTFCEGINPNLRISKARAEGEGNPIHSLSALVADFDAKADAGFVQGCIAKLPYKPNWVENTLSGHWRYVWLLEAPIFFPSYEFAVHFLASFKEIAFDVSLGMVGFDEPAWRAPEKLWTNGCDWSPIHDEKISKEITLGWMEKAGRTFKFENLGASVPLEDVAKKLAEVFPKFAEWPGEFTLGSHGPTFWIEASQSPKSATVRETGMQTFSANATKAFYLWADLLGAAFVKEFEAEKLGKAIEGVHFDGKSYWRRDPANLWISCDKAEMNLSLRATRRLSAKPGKGGLSEVDHALNFIHDHQRIDSASPHVFQPGGVIIRNGVKYLNISAVRVLAPAPGIAVWGPDGPFPWLSQFLSRLLTPEQCEVLLCWLAWAYQGFYQCKPESGHVLFIAGPVEVGKTLLNRAIIATLFGGFAEAGPFLLGDDNFNSELFSRGYWAGDDDDAGTDANRLRKWTSGIKRVSANTSWRCNEKFKKAGMTEWQGRFGITCNADEESLRSMPDLNLSNLDKLILLRTCNTAPCVFPPRYELAKILERELPYLARFILDYQIPANRFGKSRFGIKEYAEPSLLEASRHSSRQAGFVEILNDWKTTYFKSFPKLDRWEGTAFQLLREFNLDPGTAGSNRGMSQDTVGRALAGMKGKGARLDSREEKDVRVWTIYKDSEPKTNRTP